MSTIIILASGAVRADGLIDTVTGLAGDTEVALKAVTVTVLLGAVVYFTFRKGFSLPGLLMSGLIAAICAWFVLGSGIFTFQDQVGETIDNASASHVATSTAGNHHLV